MQLSVVRQLVNDEMERKVKEMVMACL